MGLLPSSIKMFLHFHKHYSFKGPVLTLGDQDIWATYDNLQSYFNNLNITITKPVQIIPHTSKMFKEDIILTRVSKNFVHAKTFFEMLNIQEYYDMDKFNNVSYIHDLNLPVPKELHNKFSLILDGGTIEHIFDMQQIMENIVNMLQPEGCIVHIGSFNIDHGFYAISPCFFYEFYSINGFSDFSCYIIQIDVSDITNTYSQKNICFKYTYGMNFKELIDLEKMVLILFTARRNKIIPFTIPTQGIFNPDKICIPEIKTDLKKDVFMFRTFIPNQLLPLFQPFYPIARILKEGIAKYHVKKQLI